MKMIKCDKANVLVSGSRIDLFSELATIINSLMKEGVFYPETIRAIVEVGLDDLDSDVGKKKVGIVMEMISKQANDAFEKAKTENEHKGKEDLSDKSCETLINLSKELFE